MPRRQSRDDCRGVSGLEGWSDRDFEAERVAGYYERGVGADYAGSLTLREIKTEAHQAAIDELIKKQDFRKRR